MAHSMFEVAGVCTFNDNHGNTEARNLKLADNLTLMGSNHGSDGIWRLPLAFLIVMKFSIEAPDLPCLIEVRFHEFRHAESQS
jgi:hypothetical protein